MDHPTRRSVLRYTGAGAGALLILPGCGPLPPGGPPRGGPGTDPPPVDPPPNDPAVDPAVGPVISDAGAPGDPAAVADAGVVDAAPAIPLDAAPPPVPIDAAPSPVPGGVAAQFPTLGQITLFAGNFEPRRWARCDGRLLPVTSNSALYSLLGTTFGGNGRTTFAIPTLAPVGQVQYIICVEGAFPSRT